MRISRTAGLVVSCAVCGALAFGSAGAAAAAPIPAPPTSNGSVVAEPLPNAEKLAAPVKLLGQMAGVLVPTTNMLNAVIAAGKLSPEEAAKHAKAMEEALKAFPKASPSPATPLSPPEHAAPVFPDTPAGGGSAPGMPGPWSDASAADPAIDLQVKAVADLRVSVDVLLKAAAKGDAKAVTPAVEATIKATSNLVGVIVMGGGLPKPDLAGMPAQPKG
ncbi:hypothetical protein [Streptomyces flavidovirens]|uniref:hypothetical protein n=1 Tax=Streptomyces flavidovirens TaxID=67298 RepID=UPI0004031A95|nr:hypothetical protein [Streptomyces flavidovirens]